MKDKKKRSRESGSGSRETTPTMSNSKGDAQLAAVFKADLVQIRSTVTCFICDQLQYEPYVLNCGHTYCYACLCNWFSQNVRKKTCPQCRASVKQIPMQNYTVKSIVEVFTKQRALMPADETAEQHAKKREEEAAEIEKDKNSAEGLFKGMFPKKPAAGTRLVWDEEDGVMRCPTCNHEHEGGPLCAVCGQELAGDPYAYSDFDEDDDEHLENIEVDLDAEEVEIDFAHMRNHHRFMDQPHFVGAHAHGAHYPHHFHHPAILSEASELSGSDGSEGTGDSDYESDSLDGFVVRDEPEVQEPIRGAGGRFVDLSSPEPALPRQRQEINLVSDDESDDEGGAISNGRSRRRRVPGAFVSSSPPPPAVPDALSISDDSTHESDYDESLSEAELRLQSAGWSPLDNGNESEVEAREPYDYEYGGYATNEDDHDDQRSDTTTETIDGNAAIYHEGEDESQGDLSDTSHSQTPTYNNESYGRGTTSYIDYGAADAYATEYYQHLGEDDDDEGANEFSTAEGASIDGDGDTEMSISTREGDRSRSNTRDTSTARAMTYAADYNEHYEARGDRGVSVTDNGHPDDVSDYDYGMPASNIYVANAMPGGEEDSSDSSIRPAVRRQPRQPRQYVQPARENVQVFHHTNPFTPVPHTRQGGRANPVYIEVAGRSGGSRRDPIQIDGACDGWEDDFRHLGGELRRLMEPASGDFRMTAYRSMPVRRADPLRSSRSPSASRVISSSSRTTRPPRHYSRRN